MANELFATGGLSVEARRWYEKQMLTRLVPQFVYNKYAKLKSIPMHGGNNLQFRRFERITTSVTALTEGTPPSETQGTFVEVNFTVNQYGQYARLSDVAIRQSQDDLLAEYSQNFAEAGADALDRITRDIVVAGTNVQYVGSNGSRGDIGSGDLLTPAEIREAVRTLSRASVPKVQSVGRYVAIIHPDVRYDFMGNSDVVNAYQYAGPRGNDANPLFTGELFDWMGVTFEVTPQAKIFSSAGFSGADVYASIVFGQDAFGAVKYDAQNMALIVKPLGSSGAVDPLNQFATVGWKASHSAGILEQARLVRIEHIASIETLAGQSDASTN